MRGVLDDPVVLADDPSAGALVADVFDRAVATHVVALIRLENAPSRRVAQKLGMRLRGSARARNGDPAEAWELRR